MFIPEDCIDVCDKAHCCKLCTDKCKDACNDTECEDHGGWPYRISIISAKWVCPTCAVTSSTGEWDSSSSYQYEGGLEWSINNAMAEDGAVCPVCGDHSHVKDIAVASGLMDKEEG